MDEEYHESEEASFEDKRGNPFRVETEQEHEFRRL